MQPAWFKTTDSNGEVRPNEGKISFKLCQFELWKMIKIYISFSILIGAWEKRANNQMTLQSFLTLSLNKLPNRTTKPKRFTSFCRSQLGFVLLIWLRRVCQSRAMSVTYLFNTPTNLCMALLNFSLFCFVLYCYAFVQYCNVKTIKYNAMPKFVVVLDNPRLSRFIWKRKIIRNSYNRRPTQTTAYNSGPSDRFKSGLFETDKGNSEGLQ